MPNKYLVEIEETCPVCEGKKHYHHPAWDLYWAETKGEGFAADIDKEVWFRAQGYLTVPQERVPCDFCDYTGTTRRRVELTEALADLGLLAGVFPSA